MKILQLKTCITITSIRRRRRHSKGKYYLKKENMIFFVELKNLSVLFNSRNLIAATSSSSLLFIFTRTNIIKNGNRTKRVVYLICAQNHKSTSIKSERKQLSIHPQSQRYTRRLNSNKYDTYVQKLLWMEIVRKWDIRARVSTIDAPLQENIRNSCVRVQLLATKSGNYGWRFIRKKDELSAGQKNDRLTAIGTGSAENNSFT